MRITSQFKIILIVFSLALVVIGSSIVITSQQSSATRMQQSLAHSIVQASTELTYLSSDYVFYHSETQLIQWQASYSSLSNYIGNLSLNTPRQQALVHDIQVNQQNMQVVFNSIVSSVENSQNLTSNPNEELSTLQVSWSRISIQSQAVISDASQLSTLLNVQENQLNTINLALIFVMIGAFLAFIAVIYLQAFRRTLKSISDLQAGSAIIGSGNLNFKLPENRNDEIGELSRSFNKMTTNLKTVTASKTELEQAQASLQQSEQRWATTLASIGDAVIATDTSGKILFMNGEAEELTGWKLNEASKESMKTVFNIINEQTRQEAENPISKVLKEGAVVGLANHTVLIQKNGAEVPIDDSGAPIKDKDGKTTGVVLVFRDITERKRVEEATARQAELIDLSPDAIIVRKLEGAISFWSKGAEKLYGWSKEEAIGQNINTLLKTEFPQPLDEILNKLKLDGEWSGEIVHTCANGNRMIVQSYWLGKFGAGGTIIELLESNVDVTDRKELQIKLEESAVRVEEYANQMEELAEKRAAQLKDAERLAAIGATAGMVGHDIRNPLQAITGDVYLVKTELASIPESEEKKNALECLTEIEKNADYINKIVADLQDFARPLRPNAEEIDVKLIIDELLKKNGLPENIKVTVNVESEAKKVFADSTFIHRIMNNLVTNAVQAMPKGGKLTIRAYKEADDVLITVKDTGVGIPEAIKPKLFTPMMTTKSKGQGFGLPVIKRMTEALGGTVSFDSQEGKGTTFFIRLPPKAKQ